MANERGPGADGAEHDGDARANDAELASAAWAAIGDDWIFTRADPGTLPTDRLPGADDLERLARASATDPDGARAASGDFPVDRGAPGTEEPGTRTDQLALPPSTRGAGSASVPSYARSGTTPSDDEVVIRGITLPERFSALSWWDAVRDVVALVCLTSAYTTPFTIADLGAWIAVPRIAIGIALASLIAAHLLRWVPRTPPLRALRLVREIAQIPAILAALAIILLDLVTSIPVLFSPLPNGPPVGVGVAVSLLLVGSLVAFEPRAHEGFLPGKTARENTRRGLLVILWVGAAEFALSLVMVVGRVFTTGWAFSLLSFASSLVSALVLVLVLSSGLRRERSRYVFAVAAVGGLVVGAICDNTLKLQFAQPMSAATGFVYLPLLFSAFAFMISRSFVRTMPLAFRRSDWILYAVRAFDFSVAVHLGAAIWCVLAGIAAIGGVGRGGPVLLFTDALLAVLFVGASLYGRRALLERPADTARATAVAAGVVLVVVGFLDVIVNSLATGAGAGLATGGVALAIGIAASLMLTVPAPVRDEYGAPDLARMYEDFRRRDDARGALPPRVPDVDRERSRRKSFPGR